MKSKFSFGRLMDSFSKLIDAEPSKGGNNLSPQQKSAQHEIENAILVLTADVIRCDKNFAKATEAFVIQFLSKQFGTNTRSSRLKFLTGHIETGTEPYVKIACKQLKMLTTQQSRLEIVRYLFGVAASDDFINKKETKHINRISGYLGVSDTDFKILKQDLLNRHSPYHLLGIDEDATYEQVKMAYRKMVLRYHPDKRRNEVSEEDASLKFREIKRAFEIIKAELENKG